jgi:nitrogenase molybdenum-iron protein NifN
LLLASSHGAETARRLGIPLLRIGFPQYDQVGGFQRCWFGYRGTTQALFDLANLVTAQHKDMPAYHSIYAQKHETEQASDTPKEWRHCV